MIATDASRLLAGAFAKVRVHIWRDGRLLCGKDPRGHSFVELAVAIDAPQLVTGLRLCQHCVRRFHLFRDAAAHVFG